MLTVVTGGLLALSILSSTWSSGITVGNHVCEYNETFRTKVQVQEPYRYHVRTTKWCLKIPPRCTEYTERWSYRLVDKEVQNTRKVQRCCQGYVGDPEASGCSPFCTSACKHGVCAAPDTCACEAGYYGPLCQQICMKGTWGTMCRNSCDCQNAAFCEPVSGDCHCSTGWLGKRCDTPCEEGFFGLFCLSGCDCEGWPCHHITGQCIIPSTTTELFSTTEITSTQPTTTELQTTTDSTSTQSTTESSTASYTLSTETHTTDATSTVTPETSTTDTPTQTSTESTSYFNLSTTTSPVLIYTDANTRQSVTLNADSVVIGRETESDFSAKSTVSTIFPVFTEESMTSTAFGSTTSAPFYDLPAATTIAAPDNNSSVISKAVNETEVAEGAAAAGKQELAQLVVTIVCSVIGAIALLVAAAGFAFAKRRKGVATQALKKADVGVYKFYGETALPVKPLFNNPTYGCETLEDSTPKTELHTFKATNDDSFEADLREMLEAHYDHPPFLLKHLESSDEHLYDEISLHLDYTEGRTDFSYS